MLALFGFLSLLVYFTNAAPLLSNNYDQKMLNGQSSYHSFSLFDLPVIAKHPLGTKAARSPIVVNHQVRADLAVAASAEADPTDSKPFTGYGEAKPSDMFVIDAPANVQETPNKDADFKPIGVVPKFTGSFMGAEQKTFADKSGAAIINPTAYFLEGANLDKVAKPKCRLIGCDGPLVDDDVYVEQNPNGEKNEKCYQAFIPIVEAQIRVGMSCRICCESGALLKELQKTRLQLDSSN